MKKLQTKPYKGARDFYPDDMQIRNYINSVWKNVCKRYGFEEYDFPILEPFEIFAAKTGEEIVNKQLFSFEDQSGRKLAMRPEITPGTVRMIAAKYKTLLQPIKWFMIGNNWRYEAPQVGRGREFNQLEVNIFGVEDVSADFEIFSLIIDMMKKFGATKDQFEILVSDRRLISALLQETLDLDEALALKTRRLMDKRAKMTAIDFSEALKEIGLNPARAEKIGEFMSSDLKTLTKIIPGVEQNKGYQTINTLMKMLKEQGLDKFVKFEPSIIRGFDYSDGLVYEVFDKNPKNNRSMFGGERFDKLINIFADKKLPATGFAMGDVTLLEFLKNWNLLPKLKPSADYFVTLFPDDKYGYFDLSQKIAAELRGAGKSVLSWLEPNTKLDKQLKYADKKGVPYSLIIGEEELKTANVTIKDMKSGKQETKSLEELLSEIE